MSARIIHVACALFNGGVFAGFLLDAFSDGTIMLEGGPARPLGHDTLVFGLLWCALNFASATLSLLAAREQRA